MNREFEIDAGETAYSLSSSAGVIWKCMGSAWKSGSTSSNTTIISKE
jgi:hypothetical protein